MIYQACFLISLISIIHCDSDFGFEKLYQEISLNLCKGHSSIICVAALYFMYHLKGLSMNVVSICTIMDSSSMTLSVDHIA
jgi:hypothetical protein